MEIYYYDGKSMREMPEDSSAYSGKHAIAFLNSDHTLRKVVVKTKLEMLAKNLTKRATPSDSAMIVFPQDIYDQTVSQLGLNSTKAKVGGGQ